MNENQNTTKYKAFKISPIQYYMKWFDGNFSMWMHHHKYIEIMYASSGSFDVDILLDKENNITQSVTITQGNLIFLSPNTYHQMKMKPDGKAFVYNIEMLIDNSYDDFMRPVDEIINVDYEKLANLSNLNTLINNKNGYGLISDTEQLGSAFKDLLIALDNKNDSYESKILILIKELNFFSEISKCLKYNKLGTVSYIRKTNAYIMENYNKKISIDDICKYVDISKSYLEHQYKKMMGQTIYNFINVLRVQKAAKLLINTSLSVSNIATKVGFTDKNQLNYEFKKIIKQSPSSYRKSISEKSIDFSNKEYFSQAINPNNK